jgi:hypothetical protein
MATNTRYNQILSIWLPSNVKDEAKEISENILKWADSISPVVRLNEPQISIKNYKRSLTNIWDTNISNLHWGIDIEIGKSVSYFKSINLLTREAYKFLFKYDKKVKLGIAPNKYASFALSRFSNKEIAITSPTNLKKDLINFPIVCLQLEEQTKNNLLELNIYSLKDLFNISPKELNNRFPKCLSKSVEKILKVCEMDLEIPLKEKRINTQKTFLHNLSSQEIFFNSLYELLERNFSILNKKHLSTSHIEIILFYDNKTCAVIPFPLSIAVATKEKTWKILKPRIENVSYENCFSILTTLKKLHEIENTQISLIEKEKQEADKNSILDFLEEARGLINENSIKIFKEGISHMSEISNNLMNLNTACKNSLSEKDLKISFNNAKKKCALLSENDRPSILLKAPLKTLITKNPEKNFTLTINSKSFIIYKFIGPEIIQTNWWHTSTTRRYYKLQLETGLWLWIYQEESPHKEWLIHGIWS